MAITKVTFDKAAYEIGDDIKVTISFKATKAAKYYAISIDALDEYGNTVTILGGDTVQEYHPIRWQSGDVSKSISSTGSYTITAICPFNNVYPPESAVSIDYLQDMCLLGWGSGHKFKVNVRLVTWSDTGNGNDFDYEATPNLYARVVAPRIESIEVIDESTTIPKHTEKFDGWFIATQTPVGIVPHVEGLLDGVEYTYIWDFNGEDWSPEITSTGEIHSIFNHEGTYATILYIRDNFGNETFGFGNPIIVIPYAPPKIESYSAERIAQDVDYDWVEDDDGGYIWHNLKARVTDFDNFRTNPWAATVYLKSRADETEKEIVLCSGMGDGDGEIELTRYVGNDDYWETYPIDKNQSFYVAVEITDWFGNTTGRIESANAITAVGALFNVEENGVAVGMVVGGEVPEDVLNKKFQCAYPAHFYGGVDPIADNEVLTFGSGVFFHGYITGSKTTINFNVPIKKDLINVKWVECTDLVANIANNGGYCLTSSYVASGTQYVRSSMTFTITVSKETNELYINMVNKSAMTANNNDNVQCRLERMTLVFHTTERGE